MADDESPTDPQAQRRRRPPTVIELAATEVASDPARPEPPQASAEPSSSTPPPSEPADANPKPPPGRRPTFSFLPEELSWSHASAAVAGAAGALLVMLVLWLGGALSGNRESPADPGPRLAAIENQLSALAARPAPASVDPKAVNQSLDEIAARLIRLESAQATPRAPVTDPVVLGRLNATETATKSIADNVASLSRRAEQTDAALREANGKIETKIEKLAAVMGDVQSTVRNAAAGSDRASRLAVAASALRNAVEHGDPFSAELAVVKPLSSDTNAIALLEPFAVTGVPSEAALGRELAALVRPTPRPAGEPSRDGGFLDRLQANAEKLVRIRPVEQEARGGDGAPNLAHVEQRAAQGNVSAALAELNKLPPEARAPTPIQAWIAKAEARNKALDASRRLAAGAVAALKATP